MPRDFLHNHPQYADLIRIVADNEGIAPAVVEKDYWIMQSLFGLQRRTLPGVWRRLQEPAPAGASPSRPWASPSQPFFAVLWPPWSFPASWGEPPAQAQPLPVMASTAEAAAFSC